MTKKIKVEIPFTGNSLPDWWNSLVVYEHFKVENDYVAEVITRCYILDKNKRYIYIYDNRKDGIQGGRINDDPVDWFKRWHKPIVKEEWCGRTTEYHTGIITDKKYFASDDRRATASFVPEVYDIANSIELKGAAIKTEYNRLSGHKTSPQFRLNVRGMF